MSLCQVVCVVPLFFSLSLSLYFCFLSLSLSLSLSFSLALSFSFFLSLLSLSLYLSLLLSLSLSLYVSVSLFFSICMCICCEVIIWAKFGHFRCYYVGQVGVIIWAKLFLAYKNRVFKRFLAHTVIILCFFCAQWSGSYLKTAFSK